MRADELHVILLVGGSTYGQWVKEDVTKAMGMEPQFYNPDLCVAAGAAIQAAGLPPVVSSEDLELTLDVPATCSLPSIHVAGRVRIRTGDDLDLPSLAVLNVVLTTCDGRTREPQELGNDGFFLFRDVDLLEDESSEFTVAVSIVRASNALEHPSASNTGLTAPRLPRFSPVCLSRSI